jgi:integrase
LSAFRQRQGIAAKALEVTLLSGLRTGKVIGARWNEIDLRNKVWTIPPERLKDRRTRSEAHRIPLSRELTNVLQSLPKIGEYVFPNSRSDKGVSNKAMLSAEKTLLKKMNRDRSGKSQWIDPKSGNPITPHGFRAFRTWGEDAGFPRDLLEESLGHQIGTAVERAYRRTDSFDRRRAIMQAWADFCSGKPIGRKPQTASRLGRGLINAQP